MMSEKKKFYQMDVEERLRLLAETSALDQADLKAFNQQAGLNLPQADLMIENVVGIYSLPLGIAQHFVVNGKAVLVPMVIEEPSVVAAASFMAKLAQAGGGFSASASSQEMIGQLQILDVPDIIAAERALLAGKEQIMERAAQADPMLVKLGGGPTDMHIRIMDDSPIGPFLVLHLIMDVKDAMGANAVNTALEQISPLVEELTGGRVLLRILSNLADRRLAKVTCTIPLEKLGFDQYKAEEVRDRIVEAWAFAAADPYRAATHNKGIMNGVDAVVIATGNDWRAIESGAHAYAARSGHYSSLSTWSVDKQGNLHGELEMPMAVGIVGGATRVHPTAKAALKLMGVQTAAELAEIIVSVGLAQNLGALRALATEGIQRGHMALHARQVAIAAGVPHEKAAAVAAQLVNEKNIRIERAIAILSEWSDK
ncbi:MAG: 3-hydroxy-3-methylglutaryl-coenzyme A reductase [Anaerolinea thermophila]|uniref:3-hydroxy-3-methylglutaryl coenzyme A reductase n=1 Tax=Anaerolinea thermophila TaxID=167964 RepID=A0A101FY42_9CHLR|nr:MAG: 3-hydroxy-3-methylglutaryl-coenzyme A reductase [Anaerolinea thermophila]